MTFPIIIAFSSSKITKSIISIFNKNGITDYISCQNLAMLKKYCHSYQNAVVISSCFLSGESLYDFMESSSYSFIIIDTKDKLNLCNNDIYKLTLPLKLEDLILAIDICIYNQEEKVKREKEKLIKKAKQKLMSSLDISEDKAHKYLQKKSMQTGKKIEQIAKAILLKLS